MVYLANYATQHAAYEQRCLNAQVPANICKTKGMEVNAQAKQYAPE